MADAASEKNKGAGRRWTPEELILLQTASEKGITSPTRIIEMYRGLASRSPSSISTKLAQLNAPPTGNDTPAEAVKSRKGRKRKAADEVQEQFLQDLFELAVASSPAPQKKKQKVEQAPDENPPISNEVPTVVTEPAPTQAPPPSPVWPRFTWQTDQHEYHMWRIADPRIMDLKIKLVEDPVHRTVIAKLTLTVAKPNREEIERYCKVGDFFSKLNFRDEVYCWDVPLPSAPKLEAVERIKDDDVKLIKVNLNYKVIDENEF